MMSPDDVIQAYVNDVAKRLPGAKRNDVALELKALLHEELQGRVEEKGQAADGDMALALVRAFGTPEEVAERYRKPSFTIIAPTSTRIFAGWALGGVVLQWLMSFPAIVSLEADSFLTTLGVWWTSYGLGAFWWPGFMVVASIIAGWVRYTWPPRENTWRPRAAEGDTINRTIWIVGAVASAFGVGLLITLLPILEHGMPAHLAAGFALNPDFMQIAAALIAFLWTLTAVEFAIVFAEGRWRPLTRYADLFLVAAWAAVLLWFVVGQRIFLAPESDKITKGALSLVLLFVLLDFAVKIYRLLRRPQLPDALASLARQ